jgi:GNAT superfamily N-acetyltransferase
MSSSPPVELVVASFDDPLVTGLRPARQAEAGPPPYGPGDAGVTFLVARQGGEPVGHTGLRRLADDTAEIERVRVRPSYRGPDITRPLLAGVEELARLRGFAVARVDAGDLRAAGLYVADGYVRIAPFGRHPARSVCLEKALRTHVPAPRPPAPALPWAAR